MSSIGIVFLLIGAAGVIDAALHPTSDWAHADRNKFFWVVGMVVLNVLFVVPYLVAVRPRFRGATNNPFHKP